MTRVVPKFASSESPATEDVHFISGQPERKHHTAVSKPDRAFSPDWKDLHGSLLYVANILPSEAAAAIMIWT